ncbi:MAG: hypothetical protein NTU91_01140 [Chloroflexi bacterium]|nr:hypothetical protein [Chloroflexota bacterium]
MAIEWRLPDENEPGYLRRRRELTAALNAPATPAAVDASVEYMLRYVAKPEDPKEAREALLDLSSVEFYKATMQLLGYKVGKVSDPKGEKSGTPSGTTAPRPSSS